MKNLITVILSLATLAFASQAQSAMIAGIPDVTLLDGNGSVRTGGCLTGPSCFVTVSSTTTSSSASDASITEVLTDTDAFSMATYALRTDPDSGAYIEIAFGNSVTNVNDLIFFFFGGNTAQGGFTNSFNLDIDLDGTIDTENNITNFIPLDNGVATTVLDLDTFRNSGGLTENYFTLTAATVDLGASGLADGEELGLFRIFLGDSETTPPFTLLAGVGYVSAVPLPLPVVLFASGLGMLGFFARKKTA